MSGGRDKDGDLDNVVRWELKGKPRKAKARDSKYFFNSKVVTEIARGDDEISKTWNNFLL